MRTAQRSDPQQKLEPLAREKFLYGFKAARRAARAANSARTPQLSLALPQRRRKAPVGWRERRTNGAAEPEEVAQAAADLTREPSRRPSLGKRGQARSQPNPRRAYGQPPLIKSATP